MRYWQPKLRSVRRGEWIVFDDTTRIAIIREVEAGTPAEPMLLAETWAAEPAERCFIGYFPVDRLRLAADVVWTEYRRETEGASGGA
jgi:hypothetical protein